MNHQHILQLPDLRPFHSRAQLPTRSHSSLETIKVFRAQGMRGAGVLLTCTAPSVERKCNLLIQLGQVSDVKPWLRAYARNSRGQTVG